MAGGFEIGLWALLITASITDLLWGKIYNLSNLLFLLTAFVLHTFNGGISELGLSLGAVAIAFIVFFPLYVTNVLAAGDVKLLIVATAWSDIKFALYLAGGAILIGSAVGMFVVLKQNGLRASLSNWSAIIRFRTPKTTSKIPFAPAFLCALFALEIMEKYQWKIL